MYQKLPRSDELYHHGILGQKWGVRRYQNKDGSLTKEGIKRLKEKYYYVPSDSVKELNEEKQNQRTQAGIVSLDDYDTIKEGSLITRYANSGEKIDKRPLYGSLTRYDTQDYSNYASEGYLRSDLSKPMSTYVYEAVKDIRVATGKKVLSDILKEYGDEKVRTVFDEAKALGDLEYNRFDNSMSKWEKEYFERSEDQRYKFLKSVLKEKQHELVDKYKKQGYDAIVDVEDWYTGVADYPVLFLDPSKSMNLKNEESRW